MSKYRKALLFQSETSICAMRSAMSNAVHEQPAEERVGSMGIRVSVSWVGLFVEFDIQAHSRRQWRQDCETCETTDTRLVVRILPGCNHPCVIISCVSAREID